MAGQGQGATEHTACWSVGLNSMVAAEGPRCSKAQDCGHCSLIRPSVRACGATQVCDVAHLQRLVVSTDAGAWGGDHARRRSVELQVGPSFPCSRASHMSNGAYHMAVE